MTYMVEFILEKCKKCFKNSVEFDEYQKLVSGYVIKFKRLFEKGGKIDAGTYRMIQESLRKGEKI